VRSLPGVEKIILYFHDGLLLFYFDSPSFPRNSVTSAIAAVPAPVSRSAAPKPGALLEHKLGVISVSDKKQAGGKLFSSITFVPVDDWVAVVECAGQAQCYRKIQKHHPYVPPECLFLV